MGKRWSKFLGILAILAASLGLSACDRLHLLSLSPSPPATPTRSPIPASVPRAPNPAQQRAIARVPLQSAANRDYTPLRHTLLTGNWEAADRETRTLLLQVAGRQREGYLDLQSLNVLPCEDLQTLNRLWEAASSGRYGFRAQQRIWQALRPNPSAGAPSISRQLDAFGLSVGWAVREEWRSRAMLQFRPDAPLGHLPLAFNPLVTAETLQEASPPPASPSPTLSYELAIVAEAFLSRPDLCEFAGDSEVLLPTPAIAPTAVP